MDPILLVFYVYLDAVLGVLSSCQSNLARYFQCMVTAKKLFAALSLCVLIFGKFGANGRNKITNVYWTMVVSA